MWHTVFVQNACCEQPFRWGSHYRTLTFILAMRLWCHDFRYFNSHFLNPVVRSMLVQKYSFIITASNDLTSP